jgi:hypothetical protein
MIVVFGSMILLALCLFGISKGYADNEADKGWKFK